MEELLDGEVPTWSDRIAERGQPVLRWARWVEGLTGNMSPMRLSSSSLVTDMLYRAFLVRHLSVPRVCLKCCEVYRFV